MGLFKFKVCVCGDKNVGKSSLIERLCEDSFTEDTIDTIGVAFKRKRVDVDFCQKQLNTDLTVWDFGGDKVFRTLFPNYVNKAAGALVLFDITRKETLEDVDEWLDIINNNADENVVKILIGTKADLEDKRQVSIKEAKEFHKKNKFFGKYVETSAKTGMNVEQAFINTAKEIINLKNKKCSSCDQIISANLKICHSCGAKV